MKSALVKRVLSIMMIAVLLTSNVMPVMAEGTSISGNVIEAVDEEETTVEESTEEVSVEESSEENVSKESSEESSVEETTEEVTDGEETTEEVTTGEETTEEETTEEETTEEMTTEEEVKLGKFRAVRPVDDGKVSVTIEHYLGDSDDEDNTLFVSDNVRVDNGGKVSNFAKGLKYYEVDKIELDGNPVSLDEEGKLLISIEEENSEEPESVEEEESSEEPESVEEEESSEESESIEEETDIEGSEEINAPLTAVIKVYYNPTTDEPDKRYRNEVAVIDYKDGGNEKGSINWHGNYPEDSNNKNRLATKGAANIYKLEVYPDPEDNSGKKVNANDYCGDRTSTPIVKGLLSGVSDGGKGDVQFAYKDPGFFSQENKEGKEILDGYEFIFDRSGVEYTLDSVLLNGVEKLGKDDLDNFFPLPEDETIIKHPGIGGHGFGFGAWEETKYSKNEYFGMRFGFDFTIGEYVGNMDYTFVGDDDLWVCMDGEVILDLGGIHREYPMFYGDNPKEYAPNHVDLWDILLEEDTMDNRIDYVESHKGEEHHITVIYMERGGDRSYCNMQFTMPNVEASKASVTANPRADLEFKKVDANETTKGLEGAKFKLYNKNDLIVEEGQEIDYSSIRAEEATSDANGVVRFEKLRIGEYLLKEVSAPEGYMRTGLEWTVKVVPVTVDGKDSAKATIYRGNRAITTIENVKATHAVSQNKEAEVVKWDDRTYKITLEASSKLRQEVLTGPVDITLAIDVSASMLCPASLTSVGEKAVSELDKSKIYYYIDGVGTKAVWCENNQWKAYETSVWEYGKKLSEQNNKSSLMVKLGESEIKEFFVSDGYSSVLLDTSKTVNEYDRMHAMKDSVKNFVDDVAKISPESTIGVVIFGAVEKDKNWKNIGPDPNYNRQVIDLKELDEAGIAELKSAIDNISTTTMGATYTNKGLALANDQIAASTSEKDNRFVVLITDGEPNCGTLPGSEFSSVDAEISYYADEIKNKATLVTMGVGIDGNKKATDFLGSIASVDDNDKAYAYTVTHADGMNGMLQIISNTILSMVSVKNATIVDYIDERFIVTDAEGEELSAGAKIEDNFGNKGTLCNDNGRWYVKWTGVTIPSNTDKQKGWFAEIHVKAKEEFMGGNMVATNGSDSGISFEDTFVPFDKPSVNVKLRDLVIKHDKTKLFKGEMITPADYLAELNKTVKVVEDASKVTIVDEAVALASAPELTPADKETLVKTKSVEVRYSYGNTKDEIGTFIYTVDSKSNLENHEAVKVGETDESVVEEYTLSVVYKADSIEDRKDNALEGLEVPNTVENTPSFDGVEVTETKPAVGTYKVHVVAGSLVINKEIEPSEIDFSHGDPIFTFKVMRKAPGEKKFKFFSYHTVRFTQGTDGKMSVDGDVLSELPKGVYTVEELDTVRYELASVEAKGVGTNAANVPDSKKAEFGIGRTVAAEDTVLNNRDGEVTFTNTKKKELNFSDTDVVVNTFSIDEDGNITWKPNTNPGVVTSTGNAE